MTSKKLEIKIGEIWKLVSELIDLEKILEGDLLDDEIKTKIEERCWKIIREINKITSENGSNEQHK